MNNNILSIVIPVKDEAENLPILLSDLNKIIEKLNQNTEVVFIDDGSKDNSFQILIELKKKFTWSKVIKFDKNYGKSAALIAGIELASGNFIVIMDADMQNLPLHIPDFLVKLKDYDIVSGYRLNRADNLRRIIQSRIANKIRNFILKDGVKDSGCGYQAFKKDCFNKITPFDGMHRFLPALFQIQGFKFCQIPIEHRPRLKGKSKYNIWNRSLNTLNDLIGVRWLKKRSIKFNVEKTN